MAKRKDTRNRTNKNMNTISQQKARANAAIDGRGGRNAAYTGGARTAQQFKNSRGYNISEQEGMKNAWNTGSNVATYTRSKNGQMSVDGRKAGGSTWAMTEKDDNLNTIRQSGRSQLANRRQREYDVRKGMNNISQRTIDAWLRTGLARVVDGNMVGSNGNTIFQKPDGNYSMGLTTG